MLLTLILVGCVRSDDGPSGALVTDAGLYTLVLAPDPDPPVVGDAALSIDVAHDGEPVDGASVAVEVWMAAMNHGIADPPVVGELGDGGYDATWVYPMTGPWDVTLTIEGEAGEDVLVVTYDVE